MKTKKEIIESDFHRGAITEKTHHDDLERFIFSCLGELELLNKIKADEIVEHFNLFIKKWCSDNYPYLIDTDENDGEKFRQAVYGNFSYLE